MNSEKLQKVLARVGIASRRTAETWISAGRVSVDGIIAKLGDRVDASANIRVDNKPIQLVNTETRVLVYHKPVGEVCTRADPEGRTTVFDHLPLLKKGRWIVVGRLDLNTTGLLLFSNDGELANYLMHPSSNITREYAVRVFGALDRATLLRLNNGVILEDGPARFTDIQSMGGEGKNHWYKVSVSEGRNRIVRRLWESQDIKVNRLMRIRFGHLLLPRDLKAGEWRELTHADYQPWLSASSR